MNWSKDDMTVFSKDMIAFCHATRDVFHREARGATNTHELYMASRLFIGLFGYGPDTDAFLEFTERLARQIDQNKENGND